MLKIFFLNTKVTWRTVVQKWIFMWFGLDWHYSTSSFCLIRPHFSILFILRVYIIPSKLLKCILYIIILRSSFTIGVKKNKKKIIKWDYLETCYEKVVHLNLLALLALFEDNYENVLLKNNLMDFCNGKGF